MPASKQELSATALADAAATSDKEACDKHGITLRTLQRWRKAQGAKAPPAATRQATGGDKATSADVVAGDKCERRKPGKPKNGAQNAPPSDPSSRAHSCPSKADRVRIIAEMMANGEWVTGVTFLELAQRWGIHPDTVKKDSAEASRSFQVSDEERADRKARWLAQLESATSNARRLKRCEAEARFLELQGKAEGFFEPQKVELSGSLGDLLSLATGAGGEDADPAVGE